MFDEVSRARRLWTHLRQTYSFVQAFRNPISESCASELTRYLLGTSRSVAFGASGLAFPRTGDADLVSATSDVGAAKLVLASHKVGDAEPKEEVEIDAVTFHARALAINVGNKSCTCNGAAPSAPPA